MKAHPFVHLAACVFLVACSPQSNTPAPATDAQPRAREAGLVAIVRVGADEFRQTVASRPDPGLGSALGGGTERELEVALKFRQPAEVPTTMPR